MDKKGLAPPKVPKTWKPGNYEEEIRQNYLPYLNIWYIHWIGLGENLQETPIFNGKNHGFL
jgi:hypothetical protein